MIVTRMAFRICGYLAAFALALIAAIILAQIALRLVGWQIPSADDFAAWALSASIFLALPATLRHGAHIRVTSLRQVMPEGVGHVADIVASALATALMGWAAWSISVFVWQSYRFAEVSQGIVAMPLWIPQSAMAVGSVLFALAFLERLVCLLMGWPVEFEGDQDEKGGT